MTSPLNKRRNVPMEDEACDATVDSVTDRLRKLPPSIISTHIYPFAVRVLETREELIDAIDEYMEAKQGGGRISCPISEWDVSEVTSFDSVFKARRNERLKDFDEDLSMWNVGNGTVFRCMFHGCESFNSDLSRWNVGNGTGFRYMFDGCKSFNSNLSMWNVGNGTDFRCMFYGCRSFNSDLSMWNVGEGTRFQYMFDGCKSFNSNLSM